MLVLTRRTEEEIVIDGDVVVKVIQVAGNRVKLGIDAPPSKTIVRGEINKKTTGEKK